MKVYHKLDPFKVVGQVIKEFFWLGVKKYVVLMPDGSFSKDWYYEWRIVE